MDILILDQWEQIVLVNGSRSIPTKVMSGVPQRSVLGSLFSLIFLGDIIESVLHSFLSSFADDTRIGKEIKTKEDSENLQRELETLYK